jgi:alpha-1,3-rhamnosyl/mannosyltransferase
LSQQFKIAAYVYPRALRMPTGVSMLTLNMVKVLSKNPAVELCLLASADELEHGSIMPPELGLAGIPVVPLPWKRPIREALWLTTNYPSIDRYVPERFWIYCTMETFVPATKARRIVTVHHLELPQKISPFSRRGVRARVAAWRLREAISTADVLVTQSQFTGKQVSKAYDVSRCRMVVVGSGASQEIFSSRNDASLDGLIPDHNPFLLVVGALDFRKGSDHLISLARELQARNSPLKIICTAGTYGDATQIAEAKRQSNIILLSFVSSKELLAYMRKAVCLMCLSRLEGFGLPMVEAMAAGLPVVAAETSAIPETLGGAGVLVNPEKSRDVADTIERIRMDAAYRESLIAKGLARAQQMFTWEACMRRLLAALD